MGRGRLVAMTSLGAVQVLVLVSLALVARSDEPHRAPVAVVAPAVVATPLVDRADDLSGGALDVTALGSAAEARRSVREGRSVAAVVVDLRGDTDTVYVAGADGDDLVRAVSDCVADVERSFGRSVRVRDLVPARAGDAGHRGVYVITALCVLLGFAVALVVTWRAGPVARTFALGARRLVVVGAVATCVGAACAVAGVLRYDAGFAAWWGVAALTVFVGAVTTLALESLFGVLGIGVASTVFVLAAAPLARLTHPLLLPGPWAEVTPWLPHGAALESMTGQAYFGGSPARPVLVLLVWALLSVLTMVVARRERSKA